MKKFIVKKYFALAILLLGVFVGGFILLSNYHNSTHKEVFNFEGEGLLCKDCAITQEEEEFINEVGQQELSGILPEATQGGTYDTYSIEKLRAGEGKKIVLFFKADWCPTCRLLDANLKAKRDLIPSDLVILAINYDTSHDLRAFYGVTTQHTLVQVSSNGTFIKKWSGGNDFHDLLSQIQ